MGFVDYLRRLLGWPSSTPASAASSRTIRVEWSPPAAALTWSGDFDPAGWSEPAWDLVWADTDDAH